MNEREIRDIEINKVNNEVRKNSEDIKAMLLNATWCEVNIKTYEKRIKHQELLFNDKKNKLIKQIDRAVENAKKTHDIVDDLLKQKEVLHAQLKKAHHFGMELCKFCERYFTPSGLKRHMTGCAKKPAVKKVAKHANEIKVEKANLEAKKAALIKLKEKEIAALKKG